MVFTMSFSCLHTVNFHHILPALPSSSHFLMVPPTSPFVFRPLYFSLDYIWKEAWYFLCESGLFSLYIQFYPFSYKWQFYFSLLLFNTYTVYLYDDKIHQLMGVSFDVKLLDMMLMHMSFLLLFLEEMEAYSQICYISYVCVCSSVVVSKFQVLQKDLWSILNGFLYRMRDRDLVSVFHIWILSYHHTICGRGCLRAQIPELPTQSWSSEWDSSRVTVMPMSWGSVETWKWKYTLKCPTSTILTHALGQQ
jgi:hypothetical protein